MLPCAGVRFLPRAILQTMYRNSGCDIHSRNELCDRELTRIEVQSCRGTYGAPFFRCQLGRSLLRVSLSADEGDVVDECIKFQDVRASSPRPLFNPELLYIEGP
jgi:hypothetical protein